MEYLSLLSISINIRAGVNSLRPSMPLSESTFSRADEYPDIIVTFF